MSNPIELLLVEDNRADAELVRIKFAKCKVENRIAVAPDGETAIRRLRREGEFVDAPLPAMVLLDLNLPGMSGIEVLEALDLDEVLRRIPVVVMSSSESRAEVQRVYELNASAYIRKPLDLPGYTAVAEAFDRFWFGLVLFPRVAG